MLFCTSVWCIDTSSVFLGYLQKPKTNLQAHFRCGFPLNKAPSSESMSVKVLRQKCDAGSPHCGLREVRHCAVPSDPYFIPTNTDDRTFGTQFVFVCSFLQKKNWTFYGLVIREWAFLDDLNLTCMSRHSVGGLLVSSERVPGKKMLRESPMVCCEDLSGILNVMCCISMVQWTLEVTKDTKSLKIMNVKGIVHP